MEHLLYLLIAVLLLTLLLRRPKSRKPLRAGPGPLSSVDEMSAEQARSILGVEPVATRADIRAAYARLMRRAHPDLGGTNGLAAQLNAARERLERP